MNYKAIALDDCLMISLNYHDHYNFIKIKFNELSGTALMDVKKEISKRVKEYFEDEKAHVVYSYDVLEVVRDIAIKNQKSIS